MKKVWVSLSMCVAALAGCSKDPGSAGSAEKAVGPDVHSLNHDQLMAIYTECHAFGPIDDPRVRYPIPYCASVDSARSSEGWASPSTAPVDPKLIQLH